MYCVQLEGLECTRSSQECTAALARPSKVAGLCSWLQQAGVLRFELRNSFQLHLVFAGGLAKLVSGFAPQDAPLSKPSQILLCSRRKVSSHRLFDVKKV
eukprot:COSAG02_NODE_228_length_28131_cov_25.387093_9_plen_99_part_00